MFVRNCHPSKTNSILFDLTKNPINQNFNIDVNIIIKNGHVDKPTGGMWHFFPCAIHYNHY